MSETPTLFTDTDMADAIAAKRAETAPGDEEIAETAQVEADEQPAEGADAEPDEAQEPDPAPGDMEEEGEPDESPVLAAPNSWPKDQIEEWNALTDAQRDLIVARELEAQQALSDKGRETAEATRKAEDAANRITTEYKDRIKKLDEMLPTVIQNFRSKYEQIDWVKLADEDPDNYTKLRAQAEAEQQQIQAAATEAHEAKVKAAAEENQRQYDELLSRNPQYVGESGLKLLSAEREEVRAYALANGFTEERLAQAGANEYETLRDAMKFRKAKKTATKPAKQPAQKAAKPGARKSNADVSKKIQSDAKANIKALAKQNAPRSKQTAAFADALAAKRRARS